jgi:hypothetical protein
MQAQVLALYMNESCEREKGFCNPPAPKTPQMTETMVEKKW